MNKHKRGVLYGLAIGDGGLYLDKSQAKDTARMIIGHGPAQLDYLKFKAKLLHSTIGGKEPSIYTSQSKNKTTGKTYTNHQMYRSYTYFRQMHRVMYKEGKKVYTEQLLSYLTDYSLAIWYMDDGSGTVCKNRNTGNACGCMTRLATYCSKEEAETLQKWFKEKYNLSAKLDVDKRNNMYSLRFNTADSRVFVSIVSPYIVPSLKYKIEHVASYPPRVQDILTMDEDIVRTIGNTNL